MNLRNKEVGNRKPKYSVFCQSSISPGFTLLELLISLTIIGLILVIVFGALRIGARAWEKGERDVETHQIQRIVLDNMKRQIASTCLREIMSEDEKYEAANKCARTAYARWNLKKNLTTENEKEVRERAGQLRMDI